MQTVDEMIDNITAHLKTFISALVLKAVQSLQAEQNDDANPGNETILFDDDRF